MLVGLDEPDEILLSQVPSKVATCGKARPNMRWKDG